MPTVIKMRCTRATDYDAGGQDMRELQLISTDREGQPLDPGVVQNASLQGNFFAPFTAEIEHDAELEVSITVIAPAPL